MGNFRQVLVTYPAQNFTQLVSEAAQSGPVYIYNNDANNTVYITDATVGTPSTVDAVPLGPLSGYGADGNTDTYAFMMTPGQTANMSLIPGGQNFFQPSIVNGSTILNTRQLLYNGNPGFGNLEHSNSLNAFTDAFGNSVLAGDVSYSGAEALEVLSGGITCYTAASQAGPWIQQSAIGFALGKAGIQLFGTAGISSIGVGTTEVTIPPSGDVTGVADSTAITVAQSGSGSVIRLTGGTYWISVPIAMAIGGVLNGAGVPLAQVTDAGYGGNATVIKAGSAFSGSEMISALSGSVVRGLRLDGSALPASVDGIAGLGAVYDVMIEDVDIYNVTGDGINAVFSGTNPFSWKMHRVNVSAAHNIGFNLPNMTDLVAVDCKAISCGNNEGWFLNGVGNSTLTACQAEECAGNGGFYLNGNASGLSLIGCSTQGNVKSGFYIDANAGNLPIVLSGCRSNGDGTNLAAGRAGIEINGSAGAIVIIDGYACYPSSVSPDCGINIFGTPGLVMTSGAYCHGISHGYQDNSTGGLRSTRGVYQRTGTIAAPGAIALVADSA